jgi:hypothetical protein
VTFLLKCVGTLVGALLIGLGSAYWAINAGLGSDIQNGAWQTDPNIGSDQATPYARAAVARAGLLALNKSETIYFTAFADDSGAPLSTACHYTLAGKPLETRWWSITAYGSDHYLIANTDDRYSQAMNTVSRGPDNEFVINVNPNGSGENGIPTGFVGPSSDDNPGIAFSLTLRLYNPDPATYSDLGGIALPTITKESCS